MTIITIKAANQYGRMVFLPVNPEAHWLTDLAGTKTLTPNALGLAERLGMKVVMAQGEADWRVALQADFRRQLAEVRS